MHLDNHYCDPRLVALYDLDSGWSADRDYYLALAQSKSKPMQILDLGCGTGLLCLAFADLGHRVTGVDPSAEMLKVGQTKDSQNRITWLQSTAQNLSVEQTFDLIIMTGHAFQVLLSEADLLATFAHVKAGLAPNGQFVFESRNPDFDWAACWDYTLDLRLADQPLQETRRLLTFQDQRLSFELVYQFAHERLTSHSQLRFWSRTEIEALLLASGLKTDKCLGDWNGEPFSPARSPEMIFHVGH
ncbi:MAG: methyltransferase domain-containing protein [Candidatus Sericytochromatia bacterium]|nr:methyltransferase domain-containing protein [Candidatus Sericytochromatia bacterium]